MVSVDGSKVQCPWKEHRRQILSEFYADYLREVSSFTFSEIAPSLSE